MNNLAIIPARGGSKRIPGKNIKDFSGKPIIAYSIEAALKSNLFEEVMVSTDDEEISKIALKYGAMVPFYRSKKKSDDFATLADVIEEVLNDYNKSGKNFNTFSCILPTAPFIKADNFILAYELLEKHNFDSVFPVVKYSSPILRSLKINDRKIEMNWPEYKNKRSQDLEDSYYDAGQFYVMRTTSFLEKKSLFTDNSGFIELEEWQAHDIDTENDWKLAEFKFTYINNYGQR